jgi:GPH family glycoside/pentoside/hexuronide:cation symporter
VFAFFQAVFWMGTGVMSPIATSMVADISEINRHDTGILKDGSYSAVFCFLIKLAGGIGLLVQGVCLKLIGFKEGSNQQPPEAIDRLVLFTFTSGAFFALVALLIAMKYRVNRRFMATIKESLAARET